MMRPAELRAQRRMTKAFVDANSTLLVLRPHTMTKTATGGSTLVAGTPRAAQPFHLGERNSGASTSTRVQGGEQQEEELTLLGYWDAQIGPHDRFEHNGREWHVIALDVDNGYEQRAQVRRYGR